MPELDSEVKLWRDSMIRRGVRTGTVEELERHLRDSFERMANSGECDVETWRQALDELGDSEEIAYEFLKVQELERGQRFIRFVTTLFALGLIVGSFYGGYAVVSVYSDCPIDLCVLIVVGSGLVFALIGGMIGTLVHRLWPRGQRLK